MVEFEIVVYEGSAQAGATVTPVTQRLALYPRRGYIIVTVERDDGDVARGITCFACGMTSFNGRDIIERYCSACSMFHER